MGGVKEGPEKSEKRCEKSGKGRFPGFSKSGTKILVFSLSYSNEYFHLLFLSFEQSGSTGSLDW